MRKLLIHLLILQQVVLFSCEFVKEKYEKSFDLQGHRGCRGLMPENSIPAMRRALEIGITTLEIDVVVSKDHKVILSHEPFMSSEICLDVEGEEISKDSSIIYNIYQMTFDEISQFDCGSKKNDEFPKQLKIEVHKPLLNEVIAKVKAFTNVQNTELPNFNIEIKSRPNWDGVFHPELNIYCDLVMEQMVKNNIENKCTIQSFDKRVLKYFHKSYPQIDLVYLLEDVSVWRSEVKSLGFKPKVISPFFPFLSGQIIKDIHAENMLVIPWTVNEKKDMISLIELGVDGIISDYPDILKQELNRIDK